MGDMENETGRPSAIDGSVAIDSAQHGVCCDGVYDSWALGGAWCAGGDDGFVSNAAAAQILRQSNSGITPDLSRRGYRVVKRAFDIVASGAALIVLFIPLLLTSIVICIKSPGAGPLYSQLRIGRLRADGSYKLFRMWKLRSMVPHADDRLPELQGENEATGPLFKMEHDPRVIPGVGQFIRKHSIDELPQLMNVFVGDMSLIGPRPGLPREVVQYSDRDRLRLEIKPGCGGPWQAGARSNGTFAEMIEMDLEYAQNCSVKGDLLLMLATVRSMVVGEGAW